VCLPAVPTVPSLIRVSWPEAGESWPLPVLHEDGHLLVLDKPAGPPVVRGEGEPDRPTLESLLQQGIRDGKAWARERGLEFLRCVHSLDADASGVWVLARSAEARIDLVNQFNADQPLASFLALTHGIPSERRFRVNLRMGPHPQEAGRMRVDPRGGRKSITRFELVEAFEGCTLWRCRPATDRLHQIRLHLRSRRLPVVSDPIYDGKPLLLSTLKPGYRFKKDEEERPLIARAAVHCEAVKLTHPATREPLRIEAPLPKDFSVALKYLRRYAAVPERVSAQARAQYNSRA
jgi:RluA family pseudouridine synthase